MIRFFKYLISIFITTIILLYFLDFLYTHIYINCKPRNKIQYILNTKNENYDAVFLGSSRVANHIDTQLFDSLSNKKTINLGAEGAGLNDNLLQLKLLISKNTVSTIFLQIDSNYEDISPSNVSTSGVMPYLNSNEIIKSHVKKYSDNFKSLKYIPFYRYAINDPKIGFREMIFSISNKNPKTDPSIGFTPKYGNNISSKEGKLPTSIKQKNSILEEIKEICNNNKIKLVLFIAPYASGTKNLNYVDKLKEKNPSLLDLSKGYDDKLFFNYNHLNIEGARIFTKNLYDLSKNKL